METKMMVTIVDQKHFDEAVEFAKRRGLYEIDESKSASNAFLHCLNTLNRWASRPNNRVMVYSDHSPYSFYWVWESTKDGGVTWQREINGGMIYFGDGDSGVGAPQFSVRIGDTNEGWQLHT